MDYLWLAIATAVFVAAVAAAADADAQLLEEFKTVVPYQASLSGWSAADGACRFPGASCRGGTLTSLSLVGVPLNADFRAVAATLLQLSGIEELSLRGANVSGALAAAGGTRCGSKLRALDLSGNAALRGSVADVAAIAGACGGLKTLNLSGDAVGAAKTGGGGGGPGFAALDALDLSSNKITGDTDLRWMVAAGVGTVRWLDLAWNGISGRLPEFSNCSGLQYLDLSGNLIVGDVAGGALSDCRGLRTLNLSNNHFAGSFPPDVTGLTSLTTLDLSNSNFSGELPGDSFAELQQLKTLSLSFNYFNGSIPDSVAAPPELEVLDLSSNAFSGTIPSSLCRGPNSTLRVLHLQNNYLAGGIPDSISGCTSLVSLDVSLNYINGSVPASLGKLGSLQDLILWQNALEGEIPATLSSIRGLQHLVLDYNGLTGSIPPALVECTQLKWISLASNRLSGPIPSWFGKLINMAILNLSNNSFSGSIPPEIGGCKSLVWLDLNSNQLNGSIPPELAKQSGKMPIGLGRPYVYLRNDELSSQCHGKGSLLELSGIRSDDLNRMPSKKLCNFTRMYMGSTEYTYSNNGSMIFIDLSFNQLDSEIPKELRSMYYLMIMNLGHNLLSGAIPPDLAGARKLAVLDLSHNRLEGSIPILFSTLSLSEINLSNNQLNGSIPELGSLATFPKSQYENNSGLCGFPLPACEHKPCFSDFKPCGSVEKGKAHTPLMVAMIALGSLFVGTFLILCIFLKYRGSKAKFEGELSPFLRESSSRLIEIIESTENFDDKYIIGIGGHGTVYKAILRPGEVYAVKKLVCDADKILNASMIRELNTLGHIRHRNLVKLKDFLLKRECGLIVYEFIENGSLHDVLHGTEPAPSLKWSIRYNIALGTAHGLAYLHNDCHPAIIHRDIKPKNILLDKDMVPHISDFGIAKFIDQSPAASQTTGIVGTIGYMAPEMAFSTRSTKGFDVYSYGVVLLGLVTRKMAVDPSFPDNLDLVDWVSSALNEGDGVEAVCDPALMNEVCGTLELEEVRNVLSLALRCTAKEASQRPSMMDVVKELTDARHDAVLLSRQEISGSNRH